MKATIRTLEGLHVVEGHPLEDLHGAEYKDFAITRSLQFDVAWTVTHLPSGQAIRFLQSAFVSDLQTSFQAFLMGLKTAGIKDPAAYMRAVGAAQIITAQELEEAHLS